MFKPKYYNQCFVLLLVNFATMSLGFGAGWPAQSLPVLTNSETCPLNSCDRTLIPLLLPVLLTGMAIGPSIVGPLLNIAGRRPCLILSCGVSSISWIMMSFSMDVLMILGARFILGIGAGSFMGIVYTYVGEISSVEIRGIFLASVVGATNVGVLITYILGAYLQFFTEIYVITFLSVLQVVALFFVPESPCYHVIRDDKAKAYAVIKWLRQTDDESEINKEIETIEISLKHTPKSLVKELFSSKINRRPFLLMLVLRFFDTFSGGFIILNYVTSILKATGMNITAEVVTIVIGATILIPNVLTPMFADKVGRRKILSISMLLNGIFLAGVGVCFYLKSVNILDMQVYGLVPVILLILCTQAGGFTSPIIGALTSELFQDKVRGIGASAVQTIYCIFMIAFSILIGYALDIMGIHVMFWMFAISCFSATIFTYFFIPETMGKTSEDIRVIFEKE